MVQGGAREFVKAIEKLGQIDGQVRELDCKKASAVRQLQALPLVAEVQMQIQEAIVATNKYLRAGDIRRAMQSLAGPDAHWKIALPDEVPENAAGQLCAAAKR